jgi:hypothetical protein
VVNYAQWTSAGDWQNVVRLESKAWFGELAEYAKPDASLRGLLRAGQNVSCTTDSAPLSPVRKLSRNGVLGSRGRTESDDSGRMVGNPDIGISL